ncbi:hypothetical protein HanRHA438_Chr06g0253451 [Helianthus annuus]|nr:hypothetical protein HanRHA438_Chr06g0253451 [Helianthus annuus]
MFVVKISNLCSIFGSFYVYNNYSFRAEDKRSRNIFYDPICLIIFSSAFFASSSVRKSGLFTLR